MIKRTTPDTATLTVSIDASGHEGGRPTIAAAQEVIVPVNAGAVADVPRLPRLGAVTR